MAIPQALLALAGFAFAHATWSVSDLPSGEMLVPLAIVEQSGLRELLRFEAESQEQAISEGKETLARHEGQFDAWAYAREGQVKEGDRYIDVLTVEAKARGDRASIVFVQRFQPFSSGSFRLLGVPIVAIDGRALPEAEAQSYLAGLYVGIQSHSKAAEHWRDWSSQ